MIRLFENISKSQSSLAILSSLWRQSTKDLPLKDFWKYLKSFRQVEQIKFRVWDLKSSIVETILKYHSAHQRAMLHNNCITTLLSLFHQYIRILVHFSSSSIFESPSDRAGIYIGNYHHLIESEILSYGKDPYQLSDLISQLFLWWILLLENFKPFSTYLSWSRAWNCARIPIGFEAIERALKFQELIQRNPTSKFIQDSIQIFLNEDKSSKQGFFGLRQPYTRSN